MSARRESYGGGQSSLGYLFGSDDDKKKNGSSTTTSPPPTPVVYAPPYGIDTEENLLNPSHPNNNINLIVSNNYRRPHGPNSGNIITGRPSTKVNSVPGGDSSLGYLFGDKSS